jgi:hypothetical protein
VQVPYDEGVAIHIGPESCAVARKGLGEALTGVRIGQPLSREVAADAFAGALTRGSIRTFPASEETTNTQRFEADSLAGGPGFEP